MVDGEPCSSRSVVAGLVVGVLLQQSCAACYVSWQWTDSTMLPTCLQSRLVALVAAQQLSIPMSDMEQRLEALMLLLPDLGEHMCWVQVDSISAKAALQQLHSSTTSQPSAVRVNRPGRFTGSGSSSPNNASSWHCRLKPLSVQGDLFTRFSVLSDVLHTS
jgi:hypothetical protein